MASINIVGIDKRYGSTDVIKNLGLDVGRAVVKEPAAFLFDEPLSNLDAALRARTRVELARLHQRLKSTMIFVTHDHVEAMTLATRIVVMNQSRIEQIGRPMEIYRHPASRFVAGFIGSPAMNFIDVTHADGIDGRRRRADRDDEQRRPRQDGMHGAAGEGDRPDHDRAGWPGLAPDHLPSVRAGCALCTGPRAAPGDSIAHLRVQDLPRGAVPVRECRARRQHGPDGDLRASSCADLAKASAWSRRSNSTTRT